MIVRKHIFFSGRVQGVGFRFRAVSIAQKLNLTGWVQNLWDGRVEMEVQGEEQTVQRMLVTLNRQPYIEIEDIETADIPPIENEHTFHW